MAWISEVRRAAKMEEAKNVFILYVFALLDFDFIYSFFLRSHNRNFLNSGSDRN